MRCVELTLRYENKKEYQGYSRDTILIFSDDELIEEMHPSLLEKLESYHSDKGEVLEIKIIYDKQKELSLIFLIIICFRTLLVNVSEYKYKKFIQKHKVDFIEFYLN